MRLIVMYLVISRHVGLLVWHQGNKRVQRPSVEETLHEFMIERSIIFRNWLLFGAVDE